MNTPQYIPSFYFYKFAQGISAPYTELAAYSAGAIDSSGNVLKAESSIDSFEYLIIKLKKIFEQLPAGLTKAQLTNYLSTLQLFSEAVQAYDISDAQFTGLVEGYIALNKNPNTSYIALCEDMGVGGGGGGAGTIGTPVVSNNQGGVGGFDPVMAPMQRRKPPVGLDNCEMFDVCPEEMGQFKLAKAWKHLPDSETKTYLKRYQARNPKGKIALRSIDPDTGIQDIHWIDYSKKSFAEEIQLNYSNIFNESLHMIYEKRLILETKKKKTPRTSDNDHEEFKAHIVGLLDLHGTAKSSAHKSEYEARLINHIKNYHAVKNNPEHLSSFINVTHPTILGSSSASSVDTHTVTFDDQGAIKFNPHDVKDISLGDAYIGKSIPKKEFEAIPGMHDLRDTSTKSKEFRVRKSTEPSPKIKSLIDADYEKNPRKENMVDTSKASFMIKAPDGRFYMAGSEAIGSHERKAQLSEIGDARRARKKNLPEPDPDLRRAGGRIVKRILDPKIENPNLSPVSVSTDEYDGIAGMFDTANIDKLQSVLKPHM
jgi:hypothetical protein